MVPGGRQGSQQPRPLAWRPSFLVLTLQALRLPRMGQFQIGHTGNHPINREGDTTGIINDLGTRVRVCEMFSFCLPYGTYADVS